MRHPIPTAFIVGFILCSDTALVRQPGREISKQLVYAGHLIGACMAERIEQQDGRAALIATIRSPFAFVRQFNAAQGRLPGARPFSAATLAVVADLEASHDNSRHPLTH